MAERASMSAMLTLDVMNGIELTDRPYGQMLVGGIIRANYRFPPTRTNIRVDGLHRIPRRGKLYLAMNHTDRYNYFPFQVELWKRRDEFTATWVKGKYFNNEWLARFMVATNNIPTPSRGYIITVDTDTVLGHPPSDALYRVLRTALDEEQTFDQARAAAELAGVLSDFEALERQPRTMLGYDYDPQKEHFLDGLRTLFHRMMGRFVSLNYEAFDRGLKIVVFPEGTRSRRLGPGRPGLAQMAIRTGATVIPIGCNGSDRVCPGDSPLAQGGDIVYRVGEPLTPEDELAPFQIDEPFQPFTKEADPYADTFDAMTDLVMERIEDLLDPRHQPAPDAKPKVEGSRRFM
jgi:1-acyl-sn-glycerol-3-phosphate acyltransferase